MATFVRPYLGPEIGAFGSEIGPYKCGHRCTYPSARMSGDGPFSVLWEWISVLWEVVWLLWKCISVLWEWISVLWEWISVLWEVLWLLWVCIS